MQTLSGGRSGCRASIAGSARPLYSAAARSRTLSSSRSGLGQQGISRGPRRCAAPLRRRPGRPVRVQAIGFELPGDPTVGKSECDTLGLQGPIAGPASRGRPEPPASLPGQPPPTSCSPPPAPAGAERQAQELTRLASSLLLYQDALAGKPGQAFLSLLLHLQKGSPEKLLEHYGELFRCLAAEGKASWQDYILDQVRRMAVGASVQLGACGARRKLPARGPGWTSSSGLPCAPAAGALPATLALPRAGASHRNCSALLPCRRADRARREQPVCQGGRPRRGHGAPAAGRGPRPGSPAAAERGGPHAGQLGERGSIWRH